MVKLCGLEMAENKGEGFSVAGLLNSRDRNLAILREIFQRQGNNKSRALCQLALNRDGAAVLLGNIIDNGQAQTCATQFSRASLIDAVKALEDALLKLRTYPYT